MLSHDEPGSVDLACGGAPAGAGPERVLVALWKAAAGRRVVFHDQLEIGRLRPGVATPPGWLQVSDPTVSARHCVIIQDSEGRCFVRDTSRNGTRIDHHRLVPGAEVELRGGQVLAIAPGVEFRLEPLEGALAPGTGTGPRGTIGAPTETLVTVLVGDIRGYTALVGEAPADRLQRSVNALFRELEQRVTRLDGTVKEYPGDAILAYWESVGSESCAERACRAALDLGRAARRLAVDRRVWRLADWPLRMDWALATGGVVIESLGGAHPVGLSVVGAPIVLASRLEKLAGDDTGAILACGRTRELAGGAFHFRDLGPSLVEGFAVPQAIFALESRR
jgi:adenylate cyclase